MSKLTWDEQGTREYHTGVSKGVLYPQTTGGVYGTGVAWNGLSAVNETGSGGEPSPIYADNIKYLNLMSAEEFGATIEAYMYPEEFAECDGSKALCEGITVGQQPRKGFGFSYQTLLGNDTDGDEHGYLIHLIYGCMASPSEKGYQTVNDSPEAITFSWEVTTTPINTGVSGMKPTSVLTIDSTKVDAAKLAQLEKILYGDETNQAKLPMPSEVLTIFQTA